MDSLAERTRRAAREHPFLLDALRAGIVNYAAAARFLAVEGDEEAVATSLRRYADDLPAFATGDRTAPVSMQSGLGAVDDADGDEALLVVGDTGFAPGAGSLTGIVATGDVDADALAVALARLGQDGVDVEAAGVAGDSLVVVVERRAGASALRAVEAAVDAVPER